MKSATQSKRDTIQVSSTTNTITAVYVSGQGAVFSGNADVATCLMARDYKGFANKTSNGAIQVKKSIVYDDYNSKVRCDQNTVGTLTTNIGIGTIRNAQKIIEQTKVKKIGGVLGKHQAGSVYSKDGLSPTLMAGMDHGNTMPFITEVEKDGRKEIG